MQSTITTCILLIFGISLIHFSNAQFTSSQEHQLLDRHNELRSDIAKGKYIVQGTNKPPASNMRKMKWDSQLAKSAQSYAETCPKGHSTNREDTGENLYWWWNPVVLDDMAIYANDSAKQWSDEFEKFGWNTNVATLPLLNSGVIHAVQMAWADTFKLGCGVSLCDGKKTVSVVCQYQPMGNFITKNIYEEGKACSACPDGTKCETSSGLCA